MSTREKNKLMSGGRVLCKVVLLAVLLWTPSVASAQSLDALLIDLRDRKRVFEHGAVEARQTRWLIKPEKEAQLEELNDYLTHTPVGATRAKDYARALEIEMVKRFGKGASKAWGFFTNEKGSKLVEIALMPGPYPEDVPLASGGLKAYGYQNGMTAIYDKLKAEMRVGPGRAEDVFAFRPAILDPTLEPFYLLEALKTSDRSLKYERLNSKTVRATLDKVNRYSYSFDTTGKPMVLASVEELTPEGAMVRKAQYGNYGALLDAEGIIPYSTIHMRRTKEGNLVVTLFVVTKWSGREIVVRDIQIRVPKGTKVVRSVKPLGRD